MLRSSLRYSVFGCFVSITFGLGGCGGKSSDVDDHDTSDSSASNDSSTGTGGSDSGSTSDGASSSGDAGSSGGSSSSDSGSSGGSSSGDAGSSGGSSSGDSGSSGGNGGSTTSSGSTVSGATTSNSGTTGVVNPTPPEDLVQGCARMCMAETGSGCANAPSASDCAGGCVVITRVESCNDDVREFFECLEGDGTTSCSEEGDVVFDGCVSEQLAAYSCILRDAPDADLEEPCEAYCSAQAEAACETSEDVTGCVLGCTAIPTVLPTCEELWVELLACTETEDFSCDENGEPTVEGCVAEYLGFWACAYPEVGE